MNKSRVMVLYLVIFIVVLTLLFFLREYMRTYSVSAFYAMASGKNESALRGKHFNLYGFLCQKETYETLEMYKIKDDLNSDSYIYIFNRTFQNHKRKHLDNHINHKVLVRGKYTKSKGYGIELEKIIAVE